MLGPIAFRCLPAAQSTASPFGRCDNGNSRPGRSMRNAKATLLAMVLHSSASVAGVVLVLLTVCAGIGSSEPVIRPEDLVAGYRQNMAAFQTLRVTWTRTSQFAPNWFNHHEKLAKASEERAAQQGLSPEERAAYLKDAESERRAISAHRDPIVLEQDYWTDRVNFQMRVLPAGTKGAAPDHSLFPDVELTPEALQGEFAGIFILSFYPSAAPSAFRIWAGAKRGAMHAAGVRGDNPNTQNPNTRETYFPPLGVSDSQWGAQWHPFDAFFSGPIEEMQVTGEDNVDGEHTYILERRVEQKDKRSFMTAEDLEQFGADMQVFRLTRAWIAPQQGYIPLRMEWDVTRTYRGKPLITARKRPGPPGRVLSEVRVRRIDGGGYYPVAGTIREYSVDANARVRGAKLADILAGRPLPPIPPMVLTEEVRWTAHRIEANRAMSADMFALPFPENTGYFDSVRSRGLVTGSAQSFLDGVITPEGEPPVASSPGAIRQRPWALIAGMVTFGVVLLAGAVRHYRKKRKAVGVRI